MGVCGCVCVSRRCVGAFEIECVREGKVSVYLSEREAMHVCVCVHVCMCTYVCLMLCVCLRVYVSVKTRPDNIAANSERTPLLYSKLSHFPQLEAEWPQRESAMLLPITTTGVRRVHASLS